MATSNFEFGKVNSDISQLNDQISNLGPYNGLDSTSTTAALSAAQGKALNDKTTWKTYIYNESGVASHNLPPSFSELEIVVCSNQRQLTKRITYDALANMFTQVAQVVELMITDFVVDSNGLPEWGACANVIIDKTNMTTRTNRFCVFHGSPSPIDSINTVLISIYYR